MRLEPLAATLLLAATLSFGCTPPPTSEAMEPYPTFRSRPEPALAYRPPHQTAALHIGATEALLAVGMPPSPGRELASATLAEPRVRLPRDTLGGKLYWAWHTQDTLGLLYDNGIVVTQDWSQEATTATTTDSWPPCHPAKAGGAVDVTIDGVAYRGTDGGETCIGCHGTTVIWSSGDGPAEPFIPPAPPIDPWQGSMLAWRDEETSFLISSCYHSAGQLLSVARSMR